MEYTKPFMPTKYVPGIARASMTSSYFPKISIDKSPIFISGLYVLVSCVWIIFSDQVVESIAGSSATFLSLLQTIKGGVFVAGTGIMLYLLVKSRLKKISASEYRYRALFEAAGDGVLLLDSNKILDCNQQMLKLFGYSDKNEVIGKHPSELSPKFQPDGKLSSKSAQDKIDAARIGIPQIFEWQHQSKNGDILDMSISLSLIDAQDGVLVAIFRDMAELKKMQQMLQQTQKMQAIGALAGGVAHDFNNILAAIIGYADMAYYEVQNNNQVSKYVENILRAGDRAKSLVSQILTFSRRGPEEKIPIPLRPIVSEVVELLRASLPSTINLNTDIHRDSSPVVADSTKVHEALMNLATNSVHALDEKGELTISLYEINSDFPQQGLIGEINPGSYSVLEVRDSGKGMNEEIMAHMFEPFFTTKDKNTGTGLGLSVVFGVMQSHNGNIQVQSDPGEGSTFKLYFPKANVPFINNEASKSQPATGNERILLVDDEETLVELEKESLIKLGYRVTATSSSLEAKDLIDNRLHEFDLIILDQTMPGITGLELAQIILKKQPGFPVILTTGYSTKVDKKKAEEIGCKGFIIKPITRLQLADAIRKALH